MLSNIKERLYKILRFSEKYTKTDMVYLAKGSFWLTFGQIISIGTSFFLAIAFANLLPKEIYGQYKYILSIFSVLLITNLSGINVALTRSVAMGFEGSLFKSLKTKIKWSLLGSIASLIMVVYYYYAGNYTLSIAFIITAIFVLVSENLAVYVPYFHGLKKFGVLTKYMSSVNIVSTLAIIITIYFTNNLYLVLLSLFIPQTLMRLALMLYVKFKYKINNKADEDTISYGKKLSFINIIATIANQLDKILIFHYIGAVELAIYSFASAPNEQIKNILKNVQNLAFPKFAQKTKEEIKSTIFKKSLKLSLITFIIVIIYVIAAPFIFKIFFPEYIEAVIYSQALAISLVTLPIWIFQSAFKAQKMTKQILHLELISSISQIIITFFLVYNFGLWGAVIARTVYRIINLTTSAILFKRS